MVDSLDKREAEIIRFRFGLDGHDELTLEEVGRHFNVTRERIRQLEHIALTKMRKAMNRNESIRSTDEIEQEERTRKRMDGHPRIHRGEEPQDEALGRHCDRAPDLRACPRSRADVVWRLRYAS